MRELVNPVAGAPLEVELALEGLEVVQVAEVFGGGDFAEDEEIAGGGAAKVVDADAMGVGGDVSK